MKKVVLVLAFMSILTVGAFADHPGGWGVGIGYNGGSSWSGGSFGSELSVFLKAPQLPVFWGINVDIFDLSDYFGIGITGDYYLFDRWLVPDIKLGWYLGVGGYFSFRHYSISYLSKDYGYSWFDFGARVPVGLTFQPFDFLEAFLEVAPSIGLNIWTGYEDVDGDLDIGGGWQGAFGVRFWF